MGNIAVSTAASKNVSNGVAIGDPGPVGGAVHCFALIIAGRRNVSGRVTMRRCPLMCVAGVRDCCSCHDSFLSTSNSPAKATRTGRCRGESRCDEFNVTCGNSSCDCGSGSFFLSGMIHRMRSDNLSSMSSCGDAERDSFGSPCGTHVCRVQVATASSRCVLNHPGVASNIASPNRSGTHVISPSFVVTSQLNALVASGMNVGPDSCNTAIF